MFEDRGHEGGDGALEGIPPHCVQAPPEVKAGRRANAARGTRRAALRADHYCEQ